MSKNIIRTLVGCLPFLWMVCGCSTKYNTAASRNFHELTLRYNVYFNAEEAYADALDQIIYNHKDNYEQLLPMFPWLAPNVNDKQKSGNSNEHLRLKGAFDRVVEKSEKAIRNHSITAKPRRDPSKAQAQSYREWLQQEEFNPFIDQAWLLMGKANLHNNDYTASLSAFSQTVRLFSYDKEVVAEAQLYMIQAYIAMGWYSDAELLITTLQAKIIPNSLINQLHAVYADFLIKQQRYIEAIPFLILAIQHESHKIQKMRWQYLLGQLYLQSNDYVNAHRAFESIKKIDASSEMILHATIAQLQTKGADPHTIQSLKKLTKNKRNEKALDQLHYAIGNSYLAQGDTVNAIQHYLLTEQIESSVYKPMSWIVLAKIFENQRDYVKAQEYYSKVLTVEKQLQGNERDLKQHANNLALLAPYIIDLHIQDSLQFVAALPIPERDSYIKQHIDNLRKTAKGEKDNALLTNANLNSRSINTSSLHNINIPPNDVFYFDDPRQVEKGKEEFLRLWGRRSLTDNWRVLSKSSAKFAVDGNRSAIKENTISLVAPPASEEIYSNEYYLRQLPLDDEKMNESNRIIQTSLYKIGVLAKDKIYDYHYAKKHFNRLLSQFPDDKNAAEVYYHLYMMERKEGDEKRARQLREDLLRLFPESKFAKTLASSDHERIMSNYTHMLDSTYNAALKSYKKGDYDDVKHSFQKSQILFPDNYLTAKFKLLFALSMIDENIDAFVNELEEVATLYPETDEAVLAKGILENIINGKRPVSGARATTSLAGNVENAFLTENIKDDSVTFNENDKDEHSCMIVFSADSIKKNELLFALAEFNFTRFMVRTFTTSFIKLPMGDALQIKSFTSFQEAFRYKEMLKEDSVFRQNLVSEVVVFVVSDQNLELIDSSERFKQYIEFLKTHKAQPVVIKPMFEGRKIIEFQNNASDGLVVDSVFFDKDKMPVKKAAEPKKEVINENENLLLKLEQKAEEAFSRHSNSEEREDVKSVKQLEKERKAQLKQRQREMKEREKLRNQELKKRAKEREALLKERERMQREKRKEREKTLKQQ